MYKNIKLLALFNFFTDFHLYSAILIIYFARVTGSYALGMALFSAVMVSTALFEIPTGIFSDYIGRKKTMMLGAFFSVLSVVFYAIGLNFWILFVGSLFQGLQRAFYSGNNEALLYETLSDSNQKEEYDHYLGKTSSMFQVAAAVGIVIGGFIAVWSFPLLMWLSVIPQIICFFISFQIVEPAKKSTQSGNIYRHLQNAFSIIWRSRKLKLLTLDRVIGFAVGESTYQFRAAFINTLWPLWAVGFSKVLSSIGAALSYWFSGKLIRRFGAFRLILVAGIYNKIIDVIFVAIPTIISPIALSTTSLFFGATGVAESKLMQNEFSNQQRATLESLNSFLGNLAFGVYAIFLGFFADKFGPGPALLFSYIISTPTLLINWILYKENKN